jgi:hypothetical protein
MFRWGHECVVDVCDGARIFRDVVCSRATAIWSGVCCDGPSMRWSQSIQSRKDVPRPKTGGGFEITEGATGSLSCHYRNTIHHVVSLFSHRLVWYRLYTVMIPPFETTFAVPLSCESCIKDVSTSLYKLPGMLSCYPSINFLSV